MKRLHIAMPARLLLTLAACLAGCSPQEAPGPAAGRATPAAATGKNAAQATQAPHPQQPTNKARAKELMRLIFAGERELEDDVTFSIVHTSGKDAHYLMRFASARQFEDGRLVVVVNGGECDADGNDESGHGAGSVNVYVLRRQAGAWKVTARHEQLADVGSFADEGDVAWAALGPGKEGFVVTSQFWDADMRFISGDADVFELGKGVRHLGSFPAMQDETSICRADRGLCTDATSTLRFAPASAKNGAAYHDILVDYTGRQYTATRNDEDESTERLHARIKQTARYRFNGTSYELVAGSAPIS